MGIVVRSCVGVLLAATLPCVFAGDAHAAPPGDWSIAIERVFGFRHIEEERETPLGDIELDWTSVSLGSQLDEPGGYSPARLALDYLANSGVTVGGALGYQSVSVGNDDDDDWWLFAARVGYLAGGDGVSAWPRGGLTHTDLDRGSSDSSATALTLEVPVIIHALGRRLGFTLMPHADIGIAGEIDGSDRTVTEFGLEFNMNAFF